MSQFTENTKAPVLKVGNFGTHVVQNPSGSYGFVGTVPNDLKDGNYISEAVAVAVFIKWFLAQDEAFKNEHSPNLRADVVQIIKEVVKIKLEEIKEEAPKRTFKVGDILSTRSACDYYCIFTCEVIKRTPKTVTVKEHGKTRRCKIHTYEGEEYIYPHGQYSMAPVMHPPKED